MGTAALWVAGCVATEPGVDPSGSTSTSEGSGTADDAEADTTATGDETGMPPANACQPSPPIVPEPPPGSECTPGGPQLGGLCHEVVELTLPEALVGYTDLFDVDGDDLPDITMVGTDWVGALVSSPDAWPRVSAISSLGEYPGPGAAADLDGDGAPELVVGRTPLTVLAGSGDGGFSGRVGTPVPGPLTAAAAADVDGDGLDDLIALHTDGSISVLRSLGGARLAADWTRSPGCLDPLAMAAADLDDDGWLDLAVSTTDGRVTVLSGDGSGGFSLGAGIEADATGTTMAAADLDGDGRSELVVVDRMGSAVHALRFASGVPELAATVPLPDSPSTVVVADLQNDGIADLIIGHADALAVSWAWGMGDGSFSAPGRVATLSPTGRIVAADIDGDGFTDAVASDGSGTLTRLLGGPRGELGSPTPGFAIDGLLGYVLVDLDGDGLPEQVSVSSDRMVVSPGEPGGGQGSASSVPLPETHTDLRFVLRARLDELPQLGGRGLDAPADHDEHLLDLGIGQRLLQDALPDQPGGSEDDDPHARCSRVRPRRDHGPRRRAWPAHARSERRERADGVVPPRSRRPSASRRARDPTSRGSGSRLPRTRGDGARTRRGRPS